MKGRNNNGHITSINRAGGHKKMYRHVDFYRKKFDVPAAIERIEYDPNRSCYIMLVKFDDNSYAYYLAPQKVKVSGFKKAIITLKKGQSIDLTTGI
jgi:large subunit ribosomal protein L2